jgi:uncharacterized membrane protein
MNTTEENRSILKPSLMQAGLLVHKASLRKGRWLTSTATRTRYVLVYFFGIIVIKTEYANLWLQWVAPNQNKPIKLMSRHTKARVTHTRRFQLLLRILSVLGAIGILFCVICISHTDVALGWIIRVAVCQSGYWYTMQKLTIRTTAKRCYSP